MHTNPSAFAQQQRCVLRHARNSDAYSFFNLLTGPELFEKVESLLPKHREPYPLLTKPRARAHAYIRKHAHPKKLK